MEKYTQVDCVRDTRAHIKDAQGNLKLVINELLQRIIDHDDSKFSEEELEVYTKVTPRLRSLTYGSDEYKENLKALGEALKHHYANNRHHPEYYANGYQGMDLIDLIEMLCDWLAATKRHADGDIHKSIKINQARFGYGEDIAQIFENTINNLFPHETS